MTTNFQFFLKVKKDDNPQNHTIMILNKIDFYAQVALGLCTIGLIVSIPYFGLLALLLLLFWQAISAILNLFAMRKYSTLYKALHITYIIAIVGFIATWFLPNFQPNPFWVILFTLVFTALYFMLTAHRTFGQNARRSSSGFLPNLEF